MAKRWAVIQQEAILRKQMFFDPTYDPVFKKIFEKKTTLIHFLNAILHLEKGHEISRIDTLKKNVKLSKAKNDAESVSVDVDFCKSYCEELGTFRFSDLGDKNALPVFPKKRYIDARASAASPRQ